MNNGFFDLDGGRLGTGSEVPLDDLLDFEEDHEAGDDCVVCPVVSVCFEVFLGALDEYVLQVFGKEVEVVWPAPGATFDDGGGVVRIFDSFSSCASHYTGLQTLFHFESLGEFVSKVSAGFCEDDPFGIEADLGLVPLKR